MASALYSADALSELRRILLSPEALTDALRPLLIDLLREHSTQLAHDVMEGLAPALRVAVHEALRDELRELSPEVASELVSALEPSVSELVRQQVTAQSGALAGLIESKIQGVADRIAVVEEAQQADPPVSASEKAVAPDLKVPPRGCRRLLVLGLVFLVTIVSTSWGWSRVDALGELFSGRGVQQGVAMAAGNGAQQPLWTPTSPLSVPLEDHAATRAYSPTFVPQTLSTSTATPDLPATQILATTPVASFAQPNPIMQPMQAQEITLLSMSEVSSVRNAFLAAKENLAPSRVYDAVADAATLNDVPAGDEANKPDDKVLYLTFDDGPNNVWTPQVLAILEQYDAHATFFVIGKEAAKRSELIRAIVNAGHIVCHHTWSHCKLEGMDRAAFEEEIERTNRALEGAISPYLRAPGGVTDADICAYAAELGLGIIHWDIDPSDWQLPSAEEISARVIRRAGPGKVVVLHDGGGDRSQTVAALPVILETLSEQGYVFKSIGQE